MGVTDAWANTDKTALYINCAAPWNWLEYDRAVAQAAVMLQEVDAPVDIIINLSSGSCLPIGRPFTHLGYAVNMLRNRIRYLVIVGGDTSSKNILSMFFGIFFPLGHKLFLVNSLEAAQIMLIEDQELFHFPFRRENSCRMGEGNRTIKSAPTLAALCRVR